MNVCEISEAEFVEKISNGIIQSKNNDWLYKFYAFCGDCFNRWYAGAIRHLPIIKTRSGEFKSAFLNGEEQLFRPSNGLNDGQIINPLFLSKSIDEELQNKLASLLSALGIRQRSPKQTIEMTILMEWETQRKKGGWNYLGKFGRYIMIRILKIKERLSNF